MGLVEKTTLKDITDSLLAITGKNCSGSIKSNAVPMLAILMYQDGVPMSQDEASGEIKRAAQEQAEATHEHAAAVAESILRLFGWQHENAAIRERANQ